MKQKWNCKQMYSNRNHQLQNMFLKRRELIKSPKLRIMTCLTMMLRCNQFSMFYWINLLSKPHLRLKKSMNSKILESLSMSTTSVGNWKMQIGNKKSSGRYNASNRKIRHLIMQEWNESSNSRPCRNCSALTLPRTSCQRISRRACSTWQTRTTGVIPSKISSMWTSRTGCTTL